MWFHHRIRRRHNRHVLRLWKAGFLSEKEAESKWWPPSASSSSKQAPHDKEKFKKRNGQFKGTGKAGSLGLPLESNSTDFEDPGMMKKEKENVSPEIPPPQKAYTEKDVEAMFELGWFSKPPFWDGGDIWKVRKGTHCLWKGVPTGKRGGESTKTELFHGMCHGWQKGRVILS